MERYTQKYRKIWETEPLFKRWIRPCKDETKAICFYCNVQVVAKHYDLVRHSETKKHIKAVESNNTSKMMQPEITFKPPAVPEERKSQAMLALYIAVHSPFSCMDHLGEVCCKAFNDSKAANMTLHRTKCTNIITNVLSPHFIELLLEDLKDSKYSLILDEGTDVSIEKVLGIVIRYFSIKKNTFITTFLTLIDVNGGKAEDLLLGLERALNIYLLDIQNLVAIGTDNASNMTGVHKGLHKLIKEKYGLKNLVLVRCVCHSLQLAVCAAAEKSFPPNVHYFVKETYTWFSNSSIRQKAYKRIYKLINSESDNPVKIPRTAQTRWLSVEKAIKAILSMWVELKAHFNVVKDNHLETKLLKEMYSDGKNFVYLTYLASVLKEVQEVNLAFESRNADHVKLFDDLIWLLKSLTNRIIIPCENFDYIGGDLEPAINRFLHFGYNFEKSCSDNKISRNDKKIIERHLLEFTKELILEIRAKLPSNIQIFKKNSLLSKENIYSSHTKSLVPIFEEFVTDCCEIEHLNNCLKNIKLCEWRDVERTDNFWIEVHNYKNSLGNNPFYKLSTFALNILTFPYSNAEVERAFSIMNLFKNKIRNKMALNTCNSLIHIQYGLKRENACCSDYVIPENVCSKINSNLTYKKSKYFIENVFWEEDEENITFFFTDDQF